MLFSKTRNKSLHLEFFFIILLLLLAFALWTVLFFPDFLFKPKNLLPQEQSPERTAAFAGIFYPSDKDKLSAQIQELLFKAPTFKSEKPPIKAIIVPNASIGYSGAVAASAYAQLPSLKNKIKHVVIISQSNKIPFAGIALSSAPKWEMPFGEVKVDQFFNKTLSELPFVRFIDDLHKNEHSIEVQLPFIREALGNVSIVPALVGKISLEEMELFINKAWRNDETLLVICSNLSYHLNYIDAKKADLETAKAILTYDIKNITPTGSNSFLAIQGLLNFAKQTGYKIENLDLRNSGDTYIRRDKVVGYGSFALYKPLVNPLIIEKELLDRIIEKHGKTLIKVAFDSIVNGLKTGKPTLINLDDYPTELKSIGASFITINKSGAVRGNMGTTIPQTSILQDIALNAFLAAFYDNNFNPLKENELPFISLKISLATLPYPISFNNEQELLDNIEQNLDGIILQELGKKPSLLSPDIWGFIKNKRLFLSQLKLQAGLDVFYWSPTITAGKFRVSSTEQRDYPELTNLWKEY